MEDGPKKLPALQFYTADYQKDTRHLSLEARGAWMDVLCLMSHATPRGRATFSGMDQFARYLGCSVSKTRKIRAELLDTNNPTGNSVADIEEGENGAFTLISRRMVRDEKLRAVRTECGRLGGNPNLVKQNGTTGDNQTRTPSSSSSTSASASPAAAGRGGRKRLSNVEVALSALDGVTP